MIVVLSTIARIALSVALGFSGQTDAQASLASEGSFHHDSAIEAQQEAGEDVSLEAGSTADLVIEAGIDIGAEPTSVPSATPTPSPSPEGQTGPENPPAVGDTPTSQVHQSPVIEVSAEADSAVDTAVTLGEATGDADIQITTQLSASADKNEGGSSEGAANATSSSQQEVGVSIPLSGIGVSAKIGL